MVLILLALVGLVSQAAASLQQETCSYGNTVMIQPGADAIIGGILRLHTPGANGYGCGDVDPFMQSYEALRYALDLVNKKNEIFNGENLTDYYVPGIRLGMQVVDYCDISTAAVSSLSDVFPSLASKQRSCTSRANLTLGVVGPSSSGAAAELAKYANSFHIPVVGFSPTAVDLTYSGDYPNFLRTVPPDNQLMEVMAQVLDELDWNYVVVVYEDSYYGREAYNSLRPALAKIGICLTAVFKADDASDAAMRTLLQQVVGADAVGTIFLGGSALADSILRNGKDVTGAGRLQWVFTDSISLERTFSADQVYARGILSLVPASRYIVEFEDHWVRIDEENPSPENPWYKQWFQDTNQCNLAGSSKYSRTCASLFPNDANSKERQKRLNFVQGQFVEPAVHTVFAYARALRNAQQAKCGQGFSGICSQLRDMTHDDFLNNYLKKVDFVYAAQERVPSLASDQYAPYKAAKRLKFDDRGDIVNPAFTLWNYNDLPVGEENSTSYKFREVGNYINGRLALIKNNIRMYDTVRTTPLPNLPTSPCPASGCSPCLGIPQDMKYYYQPGHVVINGVFSLHEEGDAKFKCGDLISTAHPLYLEAMIYAVQEVNKRSDILRGVSLGGLGIDDCMDSALSTNFIMQVQSGMHSVLHTNGSVLDPMTVQAYTAAHDNSLSLPLASLMDRFMQPMVGYRASSAALDKQHYYVKTQPGLEDELKAIVMIMKSLHWNYTQLVHDRSYTMEDANLFRRLAAREGICVVATHLFSYDNMAAVTELKRQTTVRPVVLLFSPETHRSFLRALNVTGIWTDFDFIATSSFHQEPDTTEGLQIQAQGYISIDITYSELTRFYNFLNAHNVDSYMSNPWFREWFQASKNCWLSGGERGSYTTQCSSVDSISSGPMFRKNKNVIHVINAVYAIAEGLDKTIASYCSAGYDGLCSQFLVASRSNRGNKLLEEVLKVSFNIEDTNPIQVFKFDDRSGAYKFNIYRFVNGFNQLMGTVTPSDNSMSSLQNAPTTVVLPSCPQPCVECLYMFAFQNYWYIDGDLLIPAVFDVHYRGISQFFCGALNEYNGVQYTEAFKFALDYVNGGNSGVNLNGVTLGGIAFDGCSSTARSSAIINGVMGRALPIMDDNDRPVDLSRLLAWMTYNSASTIEAADMLKMIDTPLVSPAATSPALLDKRQYSTFFRTIPSDSVIARAMANLLIDMKKFYVVTVNAPDASSRRTQQLFREYLEDAGICVIGEYEFETDGDVSAILALLNAATTNIVAVFAEADQHVPEMIRTLEIQSPSNDLIFLSNRYWDLDQMGLSSTQPGRQLIVADSLSFRLESPNVADFISYLNGLTLGANSNPWLEDYYQSVFKCNLGSNRVYSKACSNGNLGSSNNVYQHMYSLTTINAVHALAMATQQVLTEKCGSGYQGVCSRFLTDSNTSERLMAAMDNETFSDITNVLFDFVEREANRGYEIMQHTSSNTGHSQSVASVNASGAISYNTLQPESYARVDSSCSQDCLECSNFAANFKEFSYIAGDLFIVGLFDVHTQGSTPYSCGSINPDHGPQLLEAFNAAIDLINTKTGLFQGTLPGVQVGGIGIDVCKSPTRAANLVANIHSGNIPLEIGSVKIDPRQIMAYVGPFDTSTTIRVADILSAVGVPQVTYGATGLALQDPPKYPYFLRSVPADDKLSRAIISYLKNFNMSNVQLITDYAYTDLRAEFKRLASLNLVCIHKEYVVKSPGEEAESIVENITDTSNAQSKVVVVLMEDPLPILQAAGNIPKANTDFLWVVTDKWGYDVDFLAQITNLLGDRSSKKNVITFDVETADVPFVDIYLDKRTPANYAANPWFKEFYNSVFQCSWDGTDCRDRSKGIPRADDYIQDPYVLYVVNAVFSAGLGISKAVERICTSGIAGLCPRWDATGDRRDVVLSEMRKVNFTDDTLQPFYFEPTGESSRGYHIYNVTTNFDLVLPGPYEYENVGSYNDTHFLKLDITYDLRYDAYCLPYETCDCVNPFPPRIPSRYMLQPSPFELNLVYIGDIHEANPTDPLQCSNVKVGADFFKMMAFFYAIQRVNQNIDNRYPESLRLGGVALDTCSTTLRLDQDIFNLLSGYPLCDSGQTAQVVPPSSVVAFVPDGNANSIPVSRILASTGITSVSPSATSPQLREFVMSEHFLSVVPPDDVQASLMLQLMSRLRWDYASIIYTDEPSMVAAKNELLRQSTVQGLACMGQAVSLPLDADLADAEAALDQVSQQVGARAVVLFTLPPHTRLLLQATKNRGQTGRFIWIGTSAWGRDNQAIQGLEPQASGAIILQPQSGFLQDFRSFVQSLTFTNRRGIPDDWFEEIYQTLHGCKITSSRALPYSKLCTKEERISADQVPDDPALLHTVIAVYMVAQGLNQIPQCRTSDLGIAACITRIQNRNDEIYQAVLTAQWNVLPSLLNDTFSFSFNTQGYGNIGFDVLNYYTSPNGYMYQKLGTYISNNFVLSTENYQGLSLYDTGVVPNSNCIGLVCNCRGPTGVYGVAQEWQFSPRPADIVVTEEGRTYQDPITKELFYVETIPGISSRFRDMWGVAVCTLAAVGVFVSLSLFVYLLVVYPVRAGTSVLGYMLSFGIILLYALVFAFVAHVNTDLCGLRRFCLGFCYALCYSAIFVKLVDCWRSRDKQEMYEVKYNKLGKPLGLFMVTILLVLVQVMINAEWLILEPPHVVRIFYNQQYWPRCTPNDFYDEGLVLSLCYVMALILLTVLLGLCSFNNKKNHREARWILGMAVLAVPTWVIWCAWSVLGAIKTRDAAVAVGLLINATVLLLLGPVRKLYLLNKYQALIEEEDRNMQQNDRASKVNDYSSVYNTQYDNAPQLHDRASGIGSTRGPYRYPPSSLSRSVR